MVTPEERKRIKEEAEKKSAKGEQVTVEESRIARGVEDQPLGEGIVEEFDVGEREKEIGKFMTQGLSRKGALEQISKGIEAEALPSPVEERELEELQTTQQQELEQLRAGIDAAMELKPRFDRLAASGAVPFEQAQRVINKGLKAVGLGLSDETLKKRQKASLKNPMFKILTGGVGVVGDIELFGFKLSDLYDDSDTIDGLISEAKTLREMSEATLKGARDSKNYAEGARAYESIEGAIRNKYAIAMRLQRDDPTSRRTGLNAADDLTRDLNRAIRDRQILERAIITGDPTELDSRIADIELE